MGNHSEPPTLKGRVILHILEGENLHTFLDFLCIGDCSFHPRIYSIIICRSMDAWVFMLHFGLKYYITLFTELFKHPRFGH